LLQTYSKWFEPQHSNQKWFIEKKISMNNWKMFHNWGFFFLFDCM
jgi:hypothetical protein